jgi:DNA adenine methylase
MSFLRWAGSKKQLGETLAQFWFATQCAGGNGRYLEAFCGSASLFFRIKPQSSVLIDVNTRLIDCLKTVKSSPQKLSQVLKSYPTTEAFYYKLRSQDCNDLSAVDRSARFIYLNRYCFNGLYRTNLQGNFNVPYGGHRNGCLPSLEILQDASMDLRTAELVKGDFCANIASRIKPGDFVYLDPPYAKRNHSLDLQYGPDVFGVNDLKRLYDLLTLIDKSRAYFVFSYVDCEEITEIAQHWKAHSVEVNRTIAARAEKRGKAKEVLISNL